MSGADVEPGNRRRRRIALSVSLFLNVVFLVALHLGTRPHGRLPPPRSIGALQVRLIGLPQTPPSESADLPPEPEPPPLASRHATRAPARRIERARREPEPSDTATPAQPPTLDLFDRDGNVRISEMPPEPKNDGLAPPPRGDAFARRNPVPYSPTRFDKYFPPVDETLGGEIVRKTTFTKTWRTPWGTQITCSTSLVMLGLFGCGWGPAHQMTAEEMRAMHADPPMPPTNIPSPEKP